jgi:DNA-binding NarL/FixJ family response regulator
MAHALRTVLADDDDNLRFLLRYLMEQDPRYDVVGEAADGVAALEVVAATSPDLLVLDLDMPRKTGQEVAAELSRRPGPLIVVVSGVSTDLVEARLLELGVAAFIEKSIDADRLLDDIHAAALGTSGPSGGPAVDRH